MGFNPCIYKVFKDLKKKTQKGGQMEKCTTMGYIIHQERTILDSHAD